ncbi:MAG: hypothetical protein Q4C70_14740, partial [Planctomycetia bacterium]|nr:hypothetical protein [Planctomycetia bacterium]
EDNKVSETQWQRWTREENVIEKRSNGASITTPVLNDTEDRKSPEEGAPPLHTKITGIPNGLYRVYSNATSRPLAISFDGKNWKQAATYPENDYGFFDIQDGIFELWVDDLYASPKSRGWAYYDYIRLVPVTELPRITSPQAFTLPNGDTQISWITSQPTTLSKVGIRKKGDPQSVTDSGNGTDSGNVTDSGNGAEAIFTEMNAGMRNHRVIIPASELENGAEYQAVIYLPINQRDDATRTVMDFTAGALPVPEKTQKTSVVLTVSEPTEKARSNWPVVSGVPFMKGVLASAENVRLLDENGVPVPAQFETFSRWEDGSVKWLLCTFRATTRSPSEKPVTFRLETSPEFCTKPGVSPVSEAKMREFAESLESCVTFMDGTETRCNPSTFRVVSQGEQSAILESVNDFTPREGEKDFLTGYEITFFGDDFIRVRATLANRELETAMTKVRSAAVSLPGGERSSGVKILQDTVNHAVIETEVSQGEEPKTEIERWDGLINAPDGAFWLRDAWQTWPKGATCAQNRVEFQFLPELPEDYAPKDCEKLDEIMLHYYWLSENGYLFKRGMELRHEFWIMKRDKEGESGENAQKVADAEWFQKPLFACASPDYYCSVSVFPPMNPVRDGKWDVYENAFKKSFRNLETSRQTREEYGWMNFGDWYGERKYNWGNNEYDLSYVCAMAFARSGDTAYLARGTEMARHYTTVDRKAYPWTKNEKEAQYTHCYGHVNHFFTDEDPRVQGLIGSLKYSAFNWESDRSGGHAFQPGNYYIACLTGDRYLWEAAYSSSFMQADWYTPKFNFSIERAAGWVMNNAVYSYRFTNNPFFMNAARIYLETISEKQNTETGCFDLPQDQSECDCPDKKEHRGGKAFAVGVLLHSLIRFSESCPNETDRETAQTILVRAADWLLDYSWNESKMGFRYKTGCPKYADHGWYSVLVTEGIAYAGKTTQNPRYTEFLLRTLPEQLRRVSGAQETACGKGFTQQHRQIPHTLYYLDEYLKENPEKQ